MSDVQSPKSKLVTRDYEQLESPIEQIDQPSSLEPTREELAVLSSFERFAFRFVRRMNRGQWKRFWTFCQRTLGAGWIHLSTYNIMNVYGLENIEAASHDRPILVVANHRSFFDMYAVSTVLFRRTRFRSSCFSRCAVGSSINHRWAC